MASDSESDFYGDEPTISTLEKRLDSFSPEKWWTNELAQRHIGGGGALPTQPSASTTAAAAASPAVASSTSAGGPNGTVTGRLHNPYAGVPYARQLSETVDAFLARLPPSTTPKLVPGRPWIYICNPFIGGLRRNRHGLKGCADEGPVRVGEDGSGADLTTFCQGGMERLHLLGSFLDKARRGNVVSGARLTSDAEMNRERDEAVKDVLGLAKMTGVKTGKWMLFPPASIVDDVWALVARATANNELGIAAKVDPGPAVSASADDDGDDLDQDGAHDDAGKLSVSQRLPADPRDDRPRLVCIYTADFTDVADVGRVLRGLRDLGFVRPGRGRGREIYYKTDAFTYLGISGGNAWDLPASTYSSGNMFAAMKR